MMPFDAFKVCSCFYVMILVFHDLVFGHAILRHVILYVKVSSLVFFVRNIFEIAELLDFVYRMK